ncbi:unnamed protein product [Rotaria sp. Silwood1]|nr:unnamed protein product [Rotaria sp. Silwood1]
MNDEATTHYSSIIDQHSLGAAFLRDQFGECGRPKVGWQIDPFGHSREQASLLAQMGFDGLFFARADYQDKDLRTKAKTMEMDDIRLHDYNLPDFVRSFLQAAHDEQANGSNVNVFYSTPSCYLYALNKANQTWTSKSDDFFPYANHPHGYWTGYFTSRPALKRYERYSNNILQVTKQLNAFANTQARNIIFYLSEPMGVVQHHDAVSGTERQAVAFDYAQRLSDGIDAAQNVINEAYSKLLPKSDESRSGTPQFLCQLSNISQCLEINGQELFTLTLWNPTIHPVVHYARVPVSIDYTVRDPTGQMIAAELIPVSEAIQRIPGRANVAQNQTIVFKASLPALGDEKQNVKSKIKITKNEACLLQNQHLRVEIDDQGNLFRIVNLNRSITVPFTSQGFYWYEGFPDGVVEPDHQTSGAYAFRPYNQTAQPVSMSRTVTCIKTQTVQTAVIIFNNWTSQEISLYDDAEVVEIEWTVGPIPINDNIGKEVIIRYDTDIQSEAKYYTDANGREVLQRIRDYRPTWNYTVNEPVSGNYYPINSRIWIKDQTRQLTVLTDRSHGGGSIHDGSIEIMVHRRLLYNDGFGVGEALNESAFGQGLVVHGRHVLAVEQPASSARLHRVLAQQLYMHPLATYSLIQQIYANYSATYRLTWSALTDTVPLNVHLLTLDQLGPKNYLIRVEHYFELNEDDTYSQAVTFDLQSIFQSIGTINNATELTLAANFPLSELQRLNWTTNDEQSQQMKIHNNIPSQATTVTLNPMQIRTFNVTIV